MAVNNVKCVQLQVKSVIQSPETVFAPQIQLKKSVRNVLRTPGTTMLIVVVPSVNATESEPILVNAIQLLVNASVKLDLLATSAIIVKQATLNSQIASHATVTSMAQIPWNAEMISVSVLMKANVSVMLM